MGARKLDEEGLDGRVLAGCADVLRVRRGSKVAADIIGDADVSPGAEATVPVRGIESAPERKPRRKLKLVRADGTVAREVDDVALVGAVTAKAERHLPGSGARLLAATGASLRAVARAAGVTAPSVHRWLTGAKVPSAAAREALRAAYGIPIEAWMERPRGRRRCGSKPREKKPRMLKPMLTCEVCGVALSAAKSSRVRTRGVHCVCDEHKRQPAPSCRVCGCSLRRTKRALAGEQRCRTCHDLARLAPERMCIDCGAEIVGNNYAARRCGSCNVKAFAERSRNMSPEQRTKVSERVRAYWAMRREAAKAAEVSK